MKQTYHGVLRIPYAQLPPLPASAVFQGNHIVLTTPSACFPPV